MRARSHPLVLLALLGLCLALIPALAGGKAKPNVIRHICTLTNSADGDSPGVADRVAISRSYGITCARTSVSALRWDGTDVRSQALRDSDFDVVLNVNNQPPPIAVGDAAPAIPPQSSGGQGLAAYKTTLTDILDKDPPKLLTIENEEGAENFYDGSTHDYLVQFREAIKVAHRHDVKVTNGGITAIPTMLLTWDHIRKHNGREAADGFARRTLGQEHGRPFWPDLLSELLARPFTGLSNERIQASWDDAEHEVEAFTKPTNPKNKGRTPLDFVNFHWYFTDQRALKQASRYLGKETGRKVITTEIGQYDNDPAGVKNVMRQAYRSELRWIVWYDGDGDPAIALHNGDCSIRPNGEAFRDFVANHPPNQPSVPCTPAP